AAMRGEPRANAADDGRVDGAPGDDRLPLGERGQVVQQVTAYALYGGRVALLVHFLVAAPATLHQALAEEGGGQVARRVAAQSHADTELATLGEHLLEDPGGNGLTAMRSEMVRLLYEDEHRIGQVLLVASLYLATLGLQARVVDAAQQRGDDHLL